MKLTESGKYELSLEEYILLICGKDKTWDICVGHLEFEMFLLKSYLDTEKNHKISTKNLEFFPTWYIPAVGTAEKYGNLYEIFKINKEYWEICQKTNYKWGCVCNHVSLTPLGINVYDVLVEELKQLNAVPEDMFDYIKDELSEIERLSEEEITLFVHADYPKYLITKNNYHWDSIVNYRLYYVRKIYKKNFATLAKCAQLANLCIEDFLDEMRKADLFEYTDSNVTEIKKLLSKVNDIRSSDKSDECKIEKLHEIIVDCKSSIKNLDRIYRLYKRKVSKDEVD